MKTPTKEKHVKLRVKALLERHGWFYWMPPMNGFGRTGVSDFNALKSGTFLAVETKFGSNKATAMQKGFIESVMAESGIGLLVSEKNIEMFEQWLQLFDGAVATLQTGQKIDPKNGAAMLDCMAAMTAFDPA